MCEDSQCIYVYFLYYIYVHVYICEKNFADSFVNQFIIFYISFFPVMYWKLVEYPEGVEIPLGEDIEKFRVSNKDLEIYKKLKAEKEKLDLEKIGKQ